jgi:hypothetical protein
VYLKAGFYSMTNNHVDIEFIGKLDDVNETIILSPLWAGGLASALKMVLSQFPRDKVHLVVMSLGSHVEDRSGYLSVQDITGNTGNEDLVVEDLVTSLLNGRETCWSDAFRKPTTKACMDNPLG